MPDLKQRLKQWLRQRLFHWLAHRQPPAPEVVLTQKFLFVFPTAFGFSTLGLVVLLYVLGTNYQNNLILILSYCLLSLVLVCIGLSYLNLSGLTLKVSPEQAGFVGDELPILIEMPLLDSRCAIMGHFLDQPPQHLTGVRCQLPLTLQQRGRFTLPRLRLSSEYPFGLVRTWCYVSLDQHYWSYPAPRHLPAPQHQGNGDPSGDLAWHHLSSYTPGDPIKNIDWKKLARMPQQPVVKHYRPESIATEHWITLSPGPFE